MKKNIILLAILTLSLYSCSSTKYTHPLNEVADKDVVLPPAWTFGVLYGGYTNQEETISRVNNIVAHDYPIDGYWIDSWFWDYENMGRGPKKFIDFVADTVSYPNRKEMWDHLSSLNVKGGFWVWDCIFETGNEEAFNDFKEKGFFKNIYVETNSWHNKSTTTAMYETSKGNEGTVCGNIDFNNPAAVAYYKQRLKHFFDEGADFIKLDRTSSIPVCRTVFEMTQEFGKETKGRGFIMSHTGGAESPEYKRYPSKWTDDTRADWSIDKPTRKFSSWVPRVALKENIEMFTDPKRESSQIPFLTQDMGGFDMGKDPNLDENLYIRWMEFAMFCPIVEVFSQAENETGNMPYNSSKEADEKFREYSHLRMKLFPYIYSNAHNVRLKGKQMINPTNNVHTFTFGDALLLAPIFEKDKVTQTVSIPSGNDYVDFRTEDRYKAGSNVTLDTPVGITPILVKEGAIIPMRNYARSIELGSNDSLTIHIYDGASSDFSLIEDDGISNEYLEGVFAKTKMELIDNEESVEFRISKVQGYYEGMNPNRVVRIALHTKKNITSSDKSKIEVQGDIIYTSWIKLNKNRSFTIKFN